MPDNGKVHYKGIWRAWEGPEAEELSAWREEAIAIAGQNLESFRVSQAVEAKVETHSSAGLYSYKPLFYS